MPVSQRLDCKRTAQPRAALLTTALVSLLLAGCMGNRPPVGAGLSCPPSVSACSTRLQASRGFNDVVTTGSVGQVAAQVRPGQVDPGTLAGQPALRLAPLDASEAQAGVPPSAPLDLGASPPPSVAPMASNEDLGLRASTSPLTLDPPVENASFQAPAALADDPLGEAEALPGESELASAQVVDGADVPLPPRRAFSGDISVAPDTGTGPRMTLGEVVARAATMHPEVTFALAQVDEARATTIRARSGLGPQIDLTLATGQEASSNLAPSLVQPDDRSANAAMRLDGSVLLRQMLYDFDATRDQVLSSLAASDAARLRTVDVTEDIALRTAQAYLRILQQRQLLALIDRSIQEHLRLLEIVELNQADGNSTMADVNRVSARLSEVRSARTDLAAELDAAEDEFQRLARIEPGRLTPPDPVIAMLAPSADDAVQRALSGNPRLLSLSYNMRSLEHELDVVNGDGGARIDLELEANTKNYFSDNARNQSDLRGMVVFSSSLFDSGDSEGEQREVESRIRQARARYTDTRDQVEADIRQAYRAIASARRKLDDLRSGLASSREVQALYTEQFQGGERTIFELLDAQNALFSAERDLIVSQFSELEAAYSILRSTGRLTATLLNAVN
jgi:outer membrane protein TolC